MPMAMKMPTAKGGGGELDADSLKTLVLSNPAATNQIEQDRGGGGASQRGLVESTREIPCQGHGVDAAAGDGGGAV